MKALKFLFSIPSQIVAIPVILICMAIMAIGSNYLNPDDLKHVQDAGGDYIGKRTALFIMTAENIFNVIAWATLVGYLIRVYIL